MDLTYSTILVGLEAGRSNRRVLDAAQEAAERFGSAIIGNAACMPLRALYAQGTGGEAVYCGDMFEEDSEETTAEMAQAEAEFRDTLGRGSRVLTWRSAIVMTSLADDLADQASRADLVLLATASEESLNRARQIDIGDLVMQAGRPVLLIPPAPVSIGMERVVVAWKNTTESRRATAAALPLLKRASQVTLVQISEADERAESETRLHDVANWLAQHGITAGVQTRPAKGADAASLALVADELKADIIVAGAYGHSRVREWALGGVTRTLMRHAARPALLSH